MILLLQLYHNKQGEHMHFNIEHHIIPLYAVMLIIAFISMFIFMGISLYKYKVPFLLIGYSLVITSFCVICGGVLFSIFTNYDGNFSFDNMGLSSYGGAIGLIVSTFILQLFIKRIVLKQYRYIFCQFRLCMVFQN